MASASTSATASRLEGPRLEEEIDSPSGKGFWKALVRPGSRSSRMTSPEMAARTGCGWPEARRRTSHVSRNAKSPRGATRRRHAGAGGEVAVEGGDGARLSSPSPALALAALLLSAPAPAAATPVTLSSPVPRLHRRPPPRPSLPHGRPSPPAPWRRPHSWAAANGGEPSPPTEKERARPPGRAARHGPESPPLFVESTAQSCALTPRT